MSSVLKSNSDRVAAFGFPVISKRAVEATPDSAPTAPVPEQPAPEPEITAEEMYRRKLLELERKTQEIERDAYGKGFAQGEKDGVDYGQKSVQVVSAQLERIARNLETLPTRVLNDYREWLIGASITIARQIVKREISTTPEIVADLTGELLEEIGQHGTLTVYLNPGDLELVEKKAGIAPQTEGKNFVLRADAKLERGGCRVESAIRLIDASIETMFERLEKELLEPKA
ncbi:MAG: FliH/SctL family protein [Syntrophobacteraceae bacterium]